MRSWIALSALALGACAAETSSPAVADHFEVVQAPVTGTPGRPLDSIILVRLVDDRGGPVAGAAVSWSVLDGGGRVTPLTAVTGGDGIAGANWTLGATGGDQTVNIAAGGVASIQVEVEARAFRAVAIAAAEGAVCALDSIGAAWCWGGHPGYAPGYLPYGDLPTRIDSGHVFRQIVAGNEHFCALTDAGAAWCWGFGPRGELGTGAVVDSTSTPRQVTGGHAFTTITAAKWTTCAIDTAGQAWCWGIPGDGDLGTDPATDWRSPAPVQQGATLFSSISLGYEHICALEPGGQAWCWGHQDVGQLGDSLNFDANVPRQVVGGTLFRQISAGDHFTCAIALDQSLWCWGAPPLQPFTQYLTPHAMGVTGFGRIFGDAEFMVGTRNGRPVAAGSSWYNGIPPALGTPTLTEIPGGLYGIDQISFRWANFCMLRSDGMVFCVGEVPGYGSSAVPVAVPAP